MNNQTKSSCLTLPKEATTELQAMRTALLSWFREHRRTFPWRNRRTAYRVWIAEIMLQQTRADQATPYYQRFMKRFPSLRALAQATQQDVLKEWEGLGYYSRARNLHRAAQQVLQCHKGRFPREYDKIITLPGIGPYTAAAISSLAFDQSHAVVDGNVMRVFSRLFAVKHRLDTTAGKKEFQRLADQLLNRQCPGMHNEAVMELGALLCLPSSPQCLLCPLNRYCCAYRDHTQHDYPHRKIRRKLPHLHVGAGVITNSNGKILIAQRREGDMLGGLWEFPGGKQEKGETIKECIRRELLEEMDIHVDVGCHLITVNHAYSHFTMDLHAYWCTVTGGRPKAVECAAVKWVSRSRLTHYAMSKADDHIRKKVMRKK